MKIAIIGTGGVGGYFGARLLASGEKVSFLARGEHKAALEKKGLFLKSLVFQLPLTDLSIILCYLGRRRLEGSG